MQFPDPAEVSEVISGIRCARLNDLITLKLASGAAPGRRRDLADVQDMIRTLNLPRLLTDDLHPFVADSYRELWDEAGQLPPEP